MLTLEQRKPLEIKLGKKLDFWDSLDVSRETFHKLEVYKERLLLWNKKINLISKRSTGDVWGRHFLDSAQVFGTLTAEQTKVLDFGSGGGFPGIVLAIIATEKLPLIRVEMVESDQRKAVFLRDTVRTLGLNSFVWSDRVEDICEMDSDVITARALAPLKKLLFFSNRHLKKGGFCVFLKGESYKDEIKEALECWSFSIKIKESVTNSLSAMLIISDLEKR